MLKRIQLRNEDEGVSEVLGSILTLIVTVTLFSSIFIGVQSLQPPDKGNHFDFSTTFEEVNGNYYLNITNIGGEELTSDSSINLFNEEGLTEPFSFSEDSKGNDLEDGEWNLGDTLNLELDSSKEILKSKNLELVIIDKKNSRVVWEDMLKTGDVLPPIIQDYGVKYPLEWDKYAIAGDKVTLWVDVIDRDTTNELNITVNLTKLNGYTGSESLNTTNYKQKETNTYRHTLALADNQPNGTYLLKLNASDKNGNENQESYYFVLHVGKYTKIEPADIRVNANKFQFSSRSPRNGEEFGITSIIYNDGGTRATADIQFWDQYPNGTRKLMETKRNISFPIGGGREVSSNWIARSSGNHKITVNATNVSFGVGGEGSKNITVSPTILVVDDAVTKGPRSEAKTMTNALQASDFQYELFTVNGGDGPAYDSGPNPLEEYDIVIWMTGSQTSGTLTEDDQKNLNKYINANKKLWLIGEGIGEDTKASSWVESNLNVNIQSDEAPVSPMTGNEIPFESDKKFNFDESLATKSNEITPVNDAYNSLKDKSDNCYMVSYESDEQGGERTVFQPFLFCSLNERISGSRTRLAYKVIMWLGNISQKSGMDLAISSQETSDLSPKFMDTLNISATVRNNGHTGVMTEAVLEVDGSIVNQSAPFYIGPENTTSISFNWLADELGQHNVRIIVDPFDKIEETNELNNDISYQGNVSDINVEFTTLIVDDDEINGGEDSNNSTYYIENAYKSLDYTYDMFYVDKGEPGPDVDEMKYYNSICWVAGSVEEPFFEEDDVKVDIENITEYLNEYNSNFIFIGERASENIPTDFKENKLRIEQGTSSELYSPPSMLSGVKNDPITHGFEYRLKDITTDKPYHYNIHRHADPIFNTTVGDTEYTYGHRYQNESANYKITYLGVDPMHFKQAYDKNESKWYEELGYDLTGKAMREELFFKINQWFGQYDERVELRASDIDVKVSSKHPTLVIGSAFVIRAKIQNMGGTGADALIRFKDGETYIQTESMYVPAHSSKTVEVKWKPVNAGPRRPIRVIVDPLKELGEIPNKPGHNAKEDHLGFNNQAITYTDVFYFWDDMENGTGNWRHEANLALINGEVPLNYMGGQYESLDTNIKSGWSENKSLERVTWDSHSNPSSYFMEEPKGPIGRKADVFVAVVIDGSDSMRERQNSTGAYFEDAALKGARRLINSLSNKSVVSLVGYKGSDYEIKLHPTKLDTHDNRSEVNETLETWTSEGGQTPLWDSIGNAYDIVKNNYYPDLTKAVVSLTDGVDYGSNDDSTTWSQVEQGSEEWGPWHNMDPGDYPVISYNSHQGKYTMPYGTQNGEWRTITLTGPNKDRKGLLHSDIPIFNIGLGLEHHIPPNANGVSSYPGDEVVDSHTHIIGTESGTVEYNLWRVSNTSDAKYFYSPSGNDLEGIFTEIAGLLARPGNVSSVDVNENDIKSWNDPKDREGENEDKWAITPEIDISKMSSVYLSFWQKYKLLSGVNGVYMELGTPDKTTINPDDWNWTYIEPSIGPYSGNLYLEGKLPTDSQGNKIRWCWNGRSADGTLDWEYVKVDILRQLEKINSDAEKVKVRFYYKQYGGSNEPGGWLIDDLSITGSRKHNAGITPGQMDIWRDVKTQGINGDHTNMAWWNGIEKNNIEQFMGGIDNRLITDPIDLTNARTIELSADFKFNINTLPGRPPDGFRVEITTDNGITWESITLGSRAATGLSEDYDNSNFKWVNSRYVNRLLVDLSDFAGETIMLRFRVVSNNVQQHYADSSVDYGGFYVDNVVISGETL